LQNMEHLTTAILSMNPIHPQIAQHATNPNSQEAMDLPNSKLMKKQPELRKNYKELI